MFPRLLSLLKMDEVIDERYYASFFDFAPREINILLLALRLVPILQSSSSLFKVFG